MGTHIILNKLFEFKNKFKFFKKFGNEIRLNIG